MTSIKKFSMTLGGSLLLLGLAGVASAQDLGALKGGAGGDMSSMAAGSAGNAAGIIEFCVKNNYLSGDAASSMKDKLMGKMGGGTDESAQDKTDFSSGAAGMLKTGDGKSVDLAQMGSLKKSVTKKACASVLEHAKSLL
ncbi:MAG: DUF2501 domain-containing protein [Dokdonella sp.]